MRSTRGRLLTLNEDRLRESRVARLRHRLRHTAAVFASRVEKQMRNRSPRDTSRRSPTENIDIYIYTISLAFALSRGANSDIWKVHRVSNINCVQNANRSKSNRPLISRPRASRRREKRELLHAGRLSSPESCYFLALN